MKDNYTCAICKRQHDSLDSYIECVSTCGAKIKEEDNKKRFEEINTYISKVKAAKDYYEAVSNEFKTKYPKEYEINFAETCGCGSCTCHEEKTETYVNRHDGLENVKELSHSNSMEFSYENNGKDKPKMSAKLNGKELDDKVIAKLLSHPDVNCLAGLMNLL